jgi:energy-converting hydrogenase Eha subunit B
MSATCLITAAAITLANTLIIDGLLGIADMGGREAACGHCIITRSAEVSGGVFMLTGILAVLGGFL